MKRSLILAADFLAPNSKDLRKVIILAALLATSLCAQAETIATSGNSSGGKVILTDSPSDCLSGWQRAVATNPNGSTLTGCWKVTREPFDNVTVVYTLWNGEALTKPTSRQYPLDGWAITPYGVANGYSRNEAANARYRDTVRQVRKAAGGV